MTVLVSTDWPSEIDIQELLDLADLADTHSLTADAAQLRQAAEDVEVHTAYVNDLARMLESDGNPFSGIESSSEFGLSVATVFHASYQIDAAVTFTATLSTNFASGETPIYPYHQHV